MSQRDGQMLVKELQSAATTLVASTEMPVLLEAVGSLAGLLAVVETSLQDPAFASQRTNARHALCEGLIHLDHALIYAKSRLQHEHQSLSTQLHDLGAQQEWAELSRTSI